jgi:hypothetical protein
MWQGVRDLIEKKVRICEMEGRHGRDCGRVKGGMDKEGWSAKRGGFEADAERLRGEGEG